MAKIAKIAEKLNYFEENSRHFLKKLNKILEKTQGTGGFDHLQPPDLRPKKKPEINATEE